jgi:hypothetical protein
MRFLIWLDSYSGVNLQGIKIIHITEHLFTRNVTLPCSYTLYIHRNSWKEGQHRAMLLPKANSFQLSWRMIWTYI